MDKVKSIVGIGKEKGEIIYKVVLSDGRELLCDMDELRDKLSNNEISRTNISLLNNGYVMFEDSLVLTGEKDIRKKKTSASDIAKEALTMGLNADVYGKGSNEICIIHDLGSKNIVYIPNSTRNLFYKDKYHNICNILVENVKDAYEVVVLGGKGLKVGRNIFGRMSLHKLDLNGFRPYNLTDMKGLFGNSNIDYLELGEFSSSKVVNMDSMFKGCKLEKLSIKSIDTSNVENMNSMFEGIEIKNLDLSKFNTSNLKSMEKMFKGSKINQLNISSFDMKNVESTDEIFKYAIVGNVVMPRDSYSYEMLVDLLSMGIRMC